MRPHYDGSHWASDLPLTRTEPHRPFKYTYDEGLTPFTLDPFMEVNILKFPQPHFMYTPFS